MTGELFRLMNETGVSIEQVKVKPRDLVALIELVNDGKVNQNTAKLVFADMFASGRATGGDGRAQGLGASQRRR